MVDSEPKVIGATVREDQIKLKQSEATKAALASKPRPRKPDKNGMIFRGLNVIHEHHGRGNNWALGYYGPQEREGSEGSLVSLTLESVRREAERCDVFQGTFLWSSLCGGTGSGLGSRLCAEIRTQYPRRCILTACVAPFERGELPLSHYNTILAASTHQRYSDAMVLFRNDEVCAALRSLGVGGCGFQEMNSLISRTLYDLVAPSHGTSMLGPNTKLGHVKKAFRMRSFVADVAPMPSNKLVELWSTAGMAQISRKGKLQVRSSTDNGVCSRWSTGLDHLSKIIPKFDHKSNRPLTCLSFQLSLRGAKVDAKIPMKKILALKNRVADRLSCVPWNKSAGALRRLQGTTSGSKEPTICLALNRTALPGYLERVAEKGQVMFDVGAYKHWYYKHGCEEKDFEEAFATIDHVIAAYAEAARPHR